MPLLYQVRWLCSSSFKMRLYNSMTFVFFLIISACDCNWTAQKTRTFFPNWFEVPSMQTTRFRLFGPWVHGFGASERSEWSSMGTPLVVLYLAYHITIKVFMKRHMRTRYSPLCSLPESLWFSSIKEKTRGWEEESGLDVASLGGKDGLDE